MDAARAAGAEFADIRIGVQRAVSLYGYPSGPLVGQSVGYGIRAWSGGIWSFQRGNILTEDAVAATARGATAGAKRYAAIDTRLALHGRSRTLRDAIGHAWAPVPVATGEWHMPMEIDPFTVSIDDYQRVIGALGRVTLPESVQRSLSAHALGYVLEWRGETRVFASMMGSLVVQRTMVGGLGIQAVASLLPVDHTTTFLHQRQFDRLAGGFETALRADIPSRIQHVYDDAVRWEELPFRPFGDVGRFPVVLDGQTMAGVIGRTVNVALDGDRISGLEADASGGSFLSPPLDTLDAAAPQFSSLLTARVNRALPSPTAVQWDDDGVVPESYTVLDHGRVTDFHTTRQTAPMLASWYARRGQPVRSHGMSLATAPDSVPRGTGGHLFVSAALTTAPFEGLMREISHGFLVINGVVAADPGLTTGSIIRPLDGLIIEIRKGIPVARTNLRLQFKVQSALRGQLIALGDETTVETSEIVTQKGIPWQDVSQRVSAPAALCGEMDVTL
jgi:hypothetical protein